MLVLPRIAFSLVLLAAACSRPSKTAERRATDAVQVTPTDAPPADAAIAATAPIDAADDPLQRLITSAVHAEKAADATALGATIEVRLVKRYAEMNGTMQHLFVLVVVSGNGAMFAQLDNFGEDGADNEPGTLVPIPAHDPPPREHETTVTVRLPVRAPVLFSASFHIPGGNNYVAVVHHKDRLQTYSFWDDEGERADAWELRSDIRLARGARVVGR